MAYFKVEDDVVVQKQPNFEDGFIEGPDDVYCGYTYKSGKFSAPAAPTPGPTEVRKLYENAAQAMLDAAASVAGYDSIATAVSYAEEPAVPKFQQDGIAFRAWRSLVWAYAYEQLALVLAGEREQPTVDEFLQELPVLELPA